MSENERKIGNVVDRCLREGTHREGIAALSVFLRDLQIKQLELAQLIRVTKAAIECLKAAQKD